MHRRPPSVVPIGHWHPVCSRLKCAASASYNRSAQRPPMANPYLLETLRRTATVNQLQIATLIGSLARSLDLLTSDIKHEEERAGIRDMADPAYPVLARNLRARRDNIVTTIATLEALVQGHPRPPKWAKELTAPHLRTADGPRSPNPPCGLK
jgi:hypothetical protein